VKKKLIEIFSIDLRALGVFRIVFALILLFDLGQRATDLTALYSDQGILPREAVYDALVRGDRLKGSPYYLSGEPGWIAFLMGANALFLFGLLLGYRTRLMSCICWLFLIALHDRNTLILHGGDILLRVMLVWAIFLPWGARYSLDNLSNREGSAALPKTIFSIVTVGYLLQVALVYWSSAGFKWNEEWLGGQAVYYALNIDQFALPFGIWLRHQSALLPLLTHLVLYTELIGPLLAFSPFFTTPLRMIIPFGFMAMHLFFGLSLKIELFAPISIATWIPFLPSAFWDRVTAPFATFKQLPKLYSVLKPKPLLIDYHSLEKGAVAIFLFCVITYNIAAVSPEVKDHLPNKFIKAGFLLHVEQRWGMFSRPLKDDGWFVAPAKLLSGKEIDLYTGKTLTWEKPHLVSSTFKNTRWIKLMEFIWQVQGEKIRPYYAAYLCREWNRSHEGLEEVEMFQLYYMLDITHSDSKGPPKPILLWTELCK
jgi:hypothetical protein